MVPISRATLGDVIAEAILGVPDRFSPNVLRTFVALGVKPVMSPELDGLRVTYYLRTDVEAAASAPNLREVMAKVRVNVGASRRLPKGLAELAKAALKSPPHRGEAWTIEARACGDASRRVN
jgi:hypothetical protein